MAKEATACRKITIDVVCGKTKGPAKGEPSVPLMRVIGVVNGHVTKNNTFGPYTTLHGDFEATNVRTGEVFQSSACILPDKDQSQMIADHFNRATAAGESGVKFGLDVSVVYSDKSSTKYAYVSKAIRKVGEHDALGELRAELPALPKPKG